MRVENAGSSSAARARSPMSLLARSSVNGSAVLSQEGRRLIARAIAPAGARFTVESAEILRVSSSTLPQETQVLLLSPRQ